MKSWWRGRPRVSRSELCIQELQSRWCRRPIRSSCVRDPGRGTAASRARSPSTSGWREVEPAVPASAAAAGSAPGRSGPRSTPSGSGAQRRHRQPRAAAAQQQVDQDAWRDAVSRARRVSRVAASAAPGAPPEASGGAQRDLAEDLPVVPLVVGLREHRRREPRRVAHRQQVEHQVVVVALERGRRRQDHVGVPGGLVEVDVDRRHEVQAGQGPVERRAVGGRQHRVAGHGQHRADLPVAGRLDLLAQRRDGQLARRLGQPADPGAPHVEVPAADQPGADGVDRRVGEHRAADPVEVAGQEVEAVDRPHAHRAEGLGRHPDPAVDRGPVGRRRGRAPSGGSRRRARRCAPRRARGCTARRPPRRRPARRRTPGRRAETLRRGRRAASPAARTRRCRGARSGARRRPSRSRCAAGRRPPSGRRGP